MDACEAVEKELLRVITKFNAVHEHSTHLLSDVTKEFEDLKSSIAEGNIHFNLNTFQFQFKFRLSIRYWFSLKNNCNIFRLTAPQDAPLTADQIAILRDAISRTKEKLQRLTTDHRDLHGTVSKVGKTIDRNFVSDYSSTTRNDVLVQEKNIQLLNKEIAQHLHRNNLDDVAQTLIKESHLPDEELTSDPFSELHRMWEEIYNGDLKNAIQWATANSEKLLCKNSSLEFKLHRIVFLQVCSKPSPMNNLNFYTKILKLLFFFSVFVLVMFRN